LQKYWGKTADDNNQREIRNLNEDPFSRCERIWRNRSSTGRYF
jgi:hypothetical protein